jgi:hypothetical protein
MRIHSNVLTHEHLYDAMNAAKLGADGVFIIDSMVHGSRKRHHAIEVKLGANASRDRNGKMRRPRNSGQYGSDRRDPAKAATYDEWGYWIAELYVIDPDAIVGPYDNAEDFHRQTDYRYASVAA